MSSFGEEPPKETRKRDWLDWTQGSVALLTALLAVWINFQQQGLKNQHDNIDLTLKKESTTTLFTDKILQQLNAVTVLDGRNVGHRACTQNRRWKAAFRTESDRFFG
jgi:hypothetical protein